MSGLFTFILVVHCIIAVALVGVVLMQRSEGGVLGIGGSSSGLMTARGAADALTSATRWLATAFIISSISLAIIAARDRKGSSTFADELDKKGAPTQTAPVKQNPLAPDVPVPSTQLPSVALPGGDAPAAAATEQAAPPVTLPPAATELPAAPEKPAK
jgi:preprotein translocase subunit SecG